MSQVTNPKAITRMVVSSTQTVLELWKAGWCILGADYTPTGIEITYVRGECQ